MIHVTQGYHSSTQEAGESGHWESESSLGYTVSLEAA